MIYKKSLPTEAYHIEYMCLSYVCIIPLLHQQCTLPPHGYNRTCYTHKVRHLILRMLTPLFFHLQLYIPRAHDIAFIFCWFGWYSSTWYEYGKVWERSPLLRNIQGHCTLKRVCRYACNTPRVVHTNTNITLRKTRWFTGYCLHITSKRWILRSPFLYTYIAVAPGTYIHVF